MKSVLWGSKKTWVTQGAQPHSFHLVVVKMPWLLWLPNQVTYPVKIQKFLKFTDIQITLCVRHASQQMIPLKPQSSGAVHRNQRITLRAKECVQDLLLFQGAISGCPQCFTQCLKLPAASTRAPRHHSQHSIYLLHPLLHLLRVPLWLS